MIYEPQSTPARSPSQQAACRQQAAGHSVWSRRHAFVIEPSASDATAATQRSSACAALQAERSERDAHGSELQVIPQQAIEVIRALYSENSDPAAEVGMALLPRRWAFAAVCCGAASPRHPWLAAARKTQSPRPKAARTTPPAASTARRKHCSPQSSPLPPHPPPSPSRAARRSPPPPHHRPTTQTPSSPQSNILLTTQKQLGVGHRNSLLGTPPGG
jgi:hypothetical protein